MVNPSNIDDLGKLRAQITGVCAELEWAPPLWLETTVEDPGGGQASIALAAGADIVLVCGGDGTIRNVAQVLAGSGTALGLVPAGTSNVLARNLAIVLNDPARATRIALSGSNRAVDVGRVTIDGCAEEQVFLVMAGVGFDAAIMAGAPHELKSRLGPLAYFVSGIRALRGPRASIALAVDGRIAPPHQVRTVVAIGAADHLRMAGGDRARADPPLPWSPDRAALARPRRHHQRGISAAGPTRWRCGG